jgi:Flp pilus assembly protein TadG
MGRRFRTREQGQALVEFTLVLPLFVVLVLAIVQFGIALNHYLVLTDAVRAGGRVASVSRLTPDAVGTTKQAVVEAAADIGLTTDDVDVASTWQPGSDVTVAARFPYSLEIFGIVVKSGDLTSSITEVVD